MAGKLWIQYFRMETARDLRAHTTVSLNWIAKPLDIGSRGRAAWLLQRSKQALEPQSPPLLQI